MANEPGGTVAHDSEVVITRQFGAPRELVFKAFTERDRLMRWWGPAGFTTPFCSVDLRPGGEFRYCMRSPEGQDFWGKGVYTEIVPPERIVYVDSFTDEQGNIVSGAHYGMADEIPLRTTVTITLQERNGGTELTLRHSGFKPSPLVEMTKDGWSESLDRLAGELEGGQAP